MSAPWWAWLAVLLAVAVMLAIDLFLHRDNHVVQFREAAVWSAVWIAAGLAFGALLWWWQDGEVAGTYYAGYLIEKALSIDNVFVFALIFTAFAVPAGVQHKVLFWGVVGALLFRLVFIFVGAELLETVFWTAYVFGAFLVYTGYKMAFRHGEQAPPERNPVVRLVRRVVPTDPAYHGARFFTPARSWCGRRTRSRSWACAASTSASPGCCAASCTCTTGSRCCSPSPASS